MIVALALAAAISAQAAARPVETLNVERMATCQDTWLDWKDDPVRAKAFGVSFQSAFRQKPGDAFFVPRTSVTVAGLPVLQAYPASVGMGVGFSVAVDAPFDKTRKAVEQLIGKSLTHCDSSDNMRSCELTLGDKKNLILMAEATGKSKSTLLGCYYYYEK
jgi:hypothetical protein